MINFRYAKIIVILLLSLTVIFILLRQRDYTQETLELDISILGVLEENGIGKESLRYEKQETYKSKRHKFLKIERHYEVGIEFQEDNFLTAATALLENSKFNLAKSAIEKERQLESFLIAFSFKNKILYKIKFLKKKHPYSAKFKSTGAKIAIVLDDFGYNINNIEALFEVKSPLTISILPNLPYSRRIAGEAQQRNFEVILHLPLEPYREELSLEKGTIMVDMPPQRVSDLLTTAIASIPGLKGASNHMGSRATEDRDFMKSLFRELKKRDLYFLDNLVTDKSVCGEMAHEVGLLTATRSVFLDNESDESYIEKQVLYTAQLSAKTGWAIGIGHDRPHTIKILTKVIPELEKAGFEFVYVSALVK